MGKIFFIADTHFGSKELLRYENRPFASVAEMNGELIRRWNDIVSPDDEVWHLGDFGAKEHEQIILNWLNGKKFLVMGNHDTATPNYYRRAGFAEVYDHPIVYDEFWLLSHKPLYVSENMPYANIFGHVHANPQFSDFSAHHFCVCVERINYTPIALDHIRKTIQQLDA